MTESNRETPGPSDLVSLGVDHPIWNRFFHVAPLIVVATKEPDGTYDLAPKHMAAPMGWGNFFGFVCTPAHGTYRNIEREGVFTVSFPRPSQVVTASLAAAPRCEDDEKPSLSQLRTFPAREVEGVLLEDAYLHLECETFRVIDGFDENSLITGRIVEAHVSENAIRRADVDDRDTVLHAPLLAYLAPGRYAEVAETFAFPFHAGTTR
ncbi:MAG: flavin reductase [Gemmatimonadota bacterium]|nr:flavin reductase [Gemmatimonadota bacterium]